MKFGISAFISFIRINWLRHMPYPNSLCLYMHNAHAFDSIYWLNWLTISINYKLNFGIICQCQRCKLKMNYKKKTTKKHKFIQSVSWEISISMHAHNNRRRQMQLTSESHFFLPCLLISKWILFEQTKNASHRACSMHPVI